MRTRLFQQCILPLALLLGGCGKQASQIAAKKPEDAPNSTPTELPTDSPSGPEDRLSWNQRTLLGAYNGIGNRKPEWDGSAREALKTFAEMRGNGRFTEDERKIIEASCRKAISAGCDDPMIGYLHARFVMGYADILREDYASALSTASDRLHPSRYPDARKFYAAIRAAEQYAAMASSPSNASPRMYRHRRTAIMCLSNVVQDKSVPIAEIDEMCTSLFQQTAWNDFQLLEWYTITEKSLFANWGDHYQPWLLKGRYYVQQAWNARGYGLAGTVTEDRWPLFRVRLALAVEALEKAWSMHTNDARVPNEMLTAEMGQGKGRARLELWFRRAMELETNYYDACGRKLMYLEPKWHGSAEAMLAFGRECVASTNWAGQVPLILVDAHDTLAQYAKRETGDDKNYWKNAAVWTDVRGAYERFFQLNPDAVSWRHNYARHAWYCEQWDELNRQIPLLGKVNYDYFGGKSEFDRMLALAKEHAKN